MRPALHPSKLESHENWKGLAELNCAGLSQSQEPEPIGQVPMVLPPWIEHGACQVETDRSVQLSYGSKTYGLLTFEHQLLFMDPMAFRFPLIDSGQHLGLPGCWRFRA